MAPTTLLLLFILAYPVTESLLRAFYASNSRRLGAEMNFVGFDNFVWLAQYDRFWTALQNSVLLTTVAVVLEVAAGLAVALLLSDWFRGAGLVRGLFILPWAIPTIVTAFIWRGMLSPSFGLINQGIGEIQTLVTGEEHAFLLDWFSDPDWAMPAVILVHVWKGFPLIFLVLLAGLQGIPRDLGEAARIDGANGIQEFWHVTLPLLKNVILIAVILRTINVFTWFDLTWLLTGGGPQDATLVLPILVYNRAFVSFEPGTAAAINAFMFVVLAGLTYFLLSHQREDQVA